ncbi:MAG: TVP38/TMEM64 family protein [Cyanobacteria bacterium J06648_10]
MKISKKFVVFSLGSLGAMLCAIALSPIGKDTLALLLNRAVLTDYFRNAGTGSIFLFIAAHMVANAIGVPGTILVVVGGAVYGLWWGTLWSVIGATLGAIAAFFLARYLLHDWFKRRFYEHSVLKRLNKTLCADSLRCVLTVRFSPISPFNVVNFAFGLTPVSATAYALGTLIGIIPGTLAYTSLGVTGAEAMSGGNLVPLILCLGCLMLLSALPLILSGRRLDT